MGWKTFQRISKLGRSNGIKIGSWNKGGALQPLKEKLNEIEIFIKSNNF